MKKHSKIIDMIVGNTNTGFSAYAEFYPIFITGISMDELPTNSLEASSLYFESTNMKINLIHS